MSGAGARRSASRLRAAETTPSPRKAQGTPGCGRRPEEVEAELPVVRLVVIELGELRQLVSEVVREVFSMRPSLGLTDWVDQKKSPLGSKRHCAAVRLRQGSEGAAIVGRRYLLSPAALAEEMVASREPAHRAKHVGGKRSRDVIAELEAELGRG